MLADVLEEHGLRRPVRERQAAGQVPVQVGLHADHVDVHPTLERVAARAEVEAQRPDLSTAAWPSAVRAGRAASSPRTFACCRSSKLDTRRSSLAAAPRSSPRVAAALALLEIAAISSTARRYRPPVHDLAVIVVSTDQAHWLRRCLPACSSMQRGSRSTCSSSTTAPAATSARSTGRAASGTWQNRGFANANNVGLATYDARWVLFLNPDTEVLDGSLPELVAELDGRPEIGIVGVRQVDAEGRSRRRAAVPDAVTRRSATRSGSNGCPGARTGSASARCSSTATTASSRATGRSARSCSPGAKRSTPPAASTSASSSTRRRSTSACACAAPAGSVVHVPLAHDPPPRQHRPRARPAPRQPERLGAAAVRGQEPLRAVAGGDARRAPAAVRDPGLARRGEATAGGTCGDRARRRTRAAPVRASEGRMRTPAPATRSAGRAVQARAGSGDRGRVGAAGNGLRR